MLELKESFENLSSSDAKRDLVRRLSRLALIKLIIFKNFKKYFNLFQKFYLISNFTLSLMQMETPNFYYYISN